MHDLKRHLHFTVVTHFVDIAAGMLLKIGPSRSRIFPDGWGDHATLDMLSDPSILADPIPPADILWGRKEEHRGHRLTRGQFLSPSAPLLPPESRVVTFEQTEPPSGTAPPAILLPAWNDHGFTVELDEREKMTPGVFGVYEVDIAQVIDNTAIRLLRYSFVKTTVACFQVKDRYLAFFRSDHAKGGVRVA